MSTSKSLFIFSLAIIFALSSVEAARHNCPATRPDINTCYNEGNYQAVCAYTTKNCPFGACGRTEYNPCTACSDRSVSYYRDGECPQNVQVSQCQAETCTYAMDYFNFESKGYFNPVCGIQKNCPSQNRFCERTFNNICNSCSKSTAANYPFYQNGPCEHDKRYCPKNRASNCRNAQYEPVCASFRDNYNAVHWVTASSRCDACKNPTVDYYLEGACGKALNNQTYCLPNNRPQICTAIYSPVCAYYNTTDGNIEHKVVSSACVACSEQNVLWHTPGPCVFYCNRNPMLAVDCGGNLNPICGTYRENGVSKKVSLRNSCLGCYNRFNIESYTEGLCAGDIGIQCVNNGGHAFVDGFLEPVCGLTRQNCNNNSCRKTFANSLEACGNSNYVLYIPGPCPGDQGYPCSSVRNSGFSSPFVSSVCGITRNGNSTYASPAEACANSRVLYITGGDC